MGFRFLILDFVIDADDGSLCLLQKRSLKEMGMGAFYIENGIDPGDPASFDAFMEGQARGSMDGAWEYAGRKAAQQWKEEAEEEAILMAKFQATGVARNRLQREQPHLSRSENIRLAEAEGETTWKDWIDDFRPECGLGSEFGVVGGSYSVGSYSESGDDEAPPSEPFMEGHARGSTDGGCEYAGRKAAQQEADEEAMLMWREEVENEAFFRAKLKATEVARVRLQREQPHLSRNENIRLAEEEAQTTYEDWIDDFRAECGLGSESESADDEAPPSEHFGDLRGMVASTRAAPLAVQTPSAAADDDRGEPLGDRRLLEARLAESHQGWSLRRPVIEKLVDFFVSDGVDPFDQWPAEIHRPCWEAAFEEATEGHSKSAKVEFLGWLQARGTLRANSVTSTRTPYVESPPVTPPPEAPLMPSGGAGPQIFTCGYYDL